MPTRSLITLVALAAVWGASFLFMRVAVPAFGPLPMAFGRIALGALGMAALLAVMRAGWDFKGLARRTALLGLINIGLPFVMYALAARVLPAGYSAIMNSTTPMMGVLAGALFFGQRITATKGLGVLLGIVGVAVFTGTGPVAMTAPQWLGIAACLVATSCYGVGGHLVQRWIGARGGLDPRLISVGSLGGAALALAPLAVAGEVMQPIAWSALTLWQVSAMVLLGLVCTGLAYIWYYRLIAEVGPVKATTVTFLVPIFGVMWGALLLGEHITWAHAGGGLLIGLAMLMVLRK